MENSVPSELMTRAFHRDLKLFTINPNTERALVFPAVNSFSRFCLHSLVKDSYPELTTFSVGTEKERRPVVCHQSTVAMHALKADNFVNNVSMKHASPAIIQNSTENMIQVKNDENTGRNNNDDNTSNGGKSRKRPDRAVYVPPGSNRRSQAKPAQVIEPLVDATPVIALPSINLNLNPDLPPYRVEIEAILGPVRLVDPHNDYLALETGCVTSTDIIETDLPNVVELYDFPSEYKTDHLEDCLHRNLRLVNYYELKWVDDTHALAVFSDVDAAEKALNIADSFIKFRPFWSASPQSHTKARILKLTTETTRFKPRPDTSTVMAKRLLARALGMPSIAANRNEGERPKRGAARAK